MRTLLYLIPVLLLSFSAYGKKEFDDYVVSQEDSAIEVRLPVALVKSLKASMIDFSKSIGACKTASGSYRNPLIDRVSKYQISKSRAGCKVIFDAHETWTYSCILPPSEQIKLAGYMSRRALTDDVLGDLSKGEKDILFDSLFCEQSRSK